MVLGVSTTSNALVAIKWSTSLLKTAMVDLFLSFGFEPKTFRFSSLSLYRLTKLQASKC